MFDFINYINYYDYYAYFTLNQIQKHTHIYIFTFPIFTVIAGLIMKIFMTLFININL